MHKTSKDSATWHDRYSQNDQRDQRDLYYDGKQAAEQLFEQLRQECAQRSAQGVALPRIASIVFADDRGSRFYAQHKQEFAQQLGIEYQLHEHHIADSLLAIQNTIAQLNADPHITGIIVQKPTRATWNAVKNNTPNFHFEGSFTNWWNEVYAQVDPAKDIDGLHPATMQAIARGDWQEQGMVLPATVGAVLHIFEDKRLAATLTPSDNSTAPSLATPTTNQQLISIIGRSDLLGTPLYHVLRRKGYNAELLGKKELAQRIASGEYLRSSSIIVSATGQKNLITADFIAQPVALIDVGEPFADCAPSAHQKAFFVTPVPGGVGPLTVAYLFKNALSMVY